MKELGILALLSIAIFSGCNGGTTAQTRTTVSDQSILPNTNTRTPTSQTTTSDDSISSTSDSDNNIESEGAATQTNGSGDAPPNSGFSIGQ